MKLHINLQDLMQQVNMFQYKKETREETKHIISI